MLGGTVLHNYLKISNIFKDGKDARQITFLSHLLCIGVVHYPFLLIFELAHF